MEIPLNIGGKLRMINSLLLESFHWKYSTFFDEIPIEYLIYHR